MNRRPVAVPTTTVRDHLAPFIDAGWSPLVIAAAAGVSPTTVISIGKLRRPTVKAGTAATLLGLDWANLVAHQDAAKKVPALGSRRRIEALVWQGWTLDQIATHADVNPATIDRVIHGWQARTAGTTAAAIDAAYRTLWNVEPPAADWKAARSITMARRRARLHGYQPALAWDSIDDPTETPNVGKPDRRDGVHADDIAWVCRHERHTWDTLSDRFGINPHSLRAVLRRAGMHDLQARITDWSTEVAA